MASGWMESFHSELDRNVLELDEEGQVCNSWSFDYVWGSEISTSSVYDDLAKRVVEQVKCSFKEKQAHFSRMASREN